MDKIEQNGYGCTMSEIVNAQRLLIFLQTKRQLASSCGDEISADSYLDKCLEIEEKIYKLKNQRHTFDS